MLAGTGAHGFSGDGGPATAANFDVIADIKAAPDGSVYIADRGNRRIRRIDKSGIITTIASTGADGNRGDGGPATQAQLYPEALAIGPDGGVYVSTTMHGTHGRASAHIPVRDYHDRCRQRMGCLIMICHRDAATTFLPRRRSSIRSPSTLVPIGTFGWTMVRFVLRRIGPDGIVHRVTATHSMSSVATVGLYRCTIPIDVRREQARRASAIRWSVQHLRVARPTSIVLGDGGNGIIWRIGTDGLFRRVAGVASLGRRCILQATEARAAREVQRHPVGRCCPRRDAVPSQTIKTGE